MVRFHIFGWHVTVGKLAFRINTDEKREQECKPKCALQQTIHIANIYDSTERIPVTPGWLAVHRCFPPIGSCHIHPEVHVTPHRRSKENSKLWCDWFTEGNKSWLDDPSAMMMVMIMTTSCRTRICPCCNSMLTALSEEEKKKRKKATVQLKPLPFAFEPYKDMALSFCDRSQIGPNFAHTVKGFP